MTAFVHKQLIEGVRIAGYNYLCSVEWFDSFGLDNNSGSLMEYFVYCTDEHSNQFDCMANSYIYFENIAIVYNFKMLVGGSVRYDFEVYKYHYSLQVNTVQLAYYETG